TLDGEGGYRVWGRLMAANDSVSLGAVPIGLAHGVSLKNEIKEGQVVTWNDIELTEDLTASAAYRTRREMESVFGASGPARAQVARSA
ncbi:MAG: flagellar biosynthesis protein FlgA, partial [Magnetovibrio sp.]|nr:flagellar biosynthesis protein FlgA [Magnetovibrio sp.]